MSDKLTTLEYLEWFYEKCDFGPAHEDVVMIINEEIKEESGKELPDGYK